MQIRPPFGYKNVVPLRKEHRVRLLQGADSPEFAARTNAIPISFAEFAPVQRHYPIVFTKGEGDSGYLAVAVVGLGQSENLFVGNQGWAADRYVPAYVRRYPFCMSRVHVDAVEQTERLICVEQSALSDDGEALFDDQGTALERWTPIERLIVDYEADLDRCRELCARLAEYELFEPFTMKAQPGKGGEPLQLAGMYRVAEAKIAALAPERLQNLARIGAFGRMYAQLLSLDNFAHLLDRKQSSTPRTPVKKKMTKEV